MEWLDLITNFFDQSFASRWAGSCSGWTKELVVAHVLADVFIWLAYMAILVFLVRLVKDRKDLPFNVFFFLFAVFIVGCGLTHLMGAITPFYPYYYMDFWVKVVTALASVGTMWMLWKAYPQMVNLPNPYKTLILIENANKELENAKIEFHVFADFIPQLAWTALPDGYITWYNCRWYEYTGTTPADMEGWGWQSVHHPDELPKVMERWKDAIQKAIPFEMVVPLLGADGVFRPFLTRIMPFKNAQGQVVQWCGTNTDITELKERTTDLENFSLIAAHDLQDPMKQNSVLLRLIQEGKPEFMAEVIKNNIRMNKFVNSLLAFARNGGQNVKMERNSVQTIVTNVMKDLDVRIKETGAKIVVGDMPMLNCDSIQFGRIFQNLLANAMKSKSPDRPLEIEISAKQDGYFWEFSVSDNGIGIAPEQMNNLFTIYRGKKNDTTGAGFGLAICKRIIEAHKGSIYARSEVGKGTRFVFKIDV